MLKDPRICIYNKQVLCNANLKMCMHPPNKMANCIYYKCSLVTFNYRMQGHLWYLELDVGMLSRLFSTLSIQTYTQPVLILYFIASRNTDVQLCHCKLMSSLRLPHEIIHELASRKNDKSTTLGHFQIKVLNLNCPLHIWPQNWKYFSIKIII